MTPEELVEMSLPELEKEYARASALIKPQQLKLIEAVIAGASFHEAGAKANYSNKNTEHAVRRALGYPKVAIALALGRELASRGAKTEATWLRKKLRALMEQAEEDGDRTTVLACTREFAKIDGLYSEQATKLMLANHEGGALHREIDDDEWRLLAQLQHDMRDSDEESVH